MTAHINTRWHLLLARPGRGLIPVCDVPWEGAPFYRSATVDDLFSADVMTRVSRFEARVYRQPAGQRLLPQRGMHRR